MTWPRPWLQAVLTDADVRRALDRNVWRTVSELASRLYLTRHAYRMQIATLLRRGVQRGTVETRRRQRIGKGPGGGPQEYRRA